MKNNEIDSTIEKKTKWYSKVFNVLRLNSIHGRNILSNIILMAITVVFAWVIQSKLSDTSQINSANLTDRETIRRDLNALSDAIWQLETRFQAYMLSPEEESNQYVLLQVIAIKNNVNKLASHKKSTTDSFQRKIDAFSSTTIKLEKEIGYAMSLRANPAKVFPVMNVLVNELNPNSVLFYQKASVAMQESEELGLKGKQLVIFRLFGAIRFNWLLRINTFRMFSAARMGLFVDSSKDTMKAQMYDMDLYDEQIFKDINKLKELDEQKKLGFLQSDNLDKMIEHRERWNKAYKVAVQLLTVEKGWRRDSLAIKNKVIPLFNLLWVLLSDINKQVALDAAKDINITSSVADQALNSLWLIAIVICLAAITSILAFDFQIRRPLINVSRALKAEADGEAVTDLPNTYLNETRDLIDAFSKMRKKVAVRQEYLQSVLSYSAESIITVNRDGVIENFNPAAEKLFGYDHQDIIGKNVKSLVPERFYERFDEYVHRELRLAQRNMIVNGAETVGRHRQGYDISIIVHVTEMYVDGRQLFLGMVSDDRERRNMLDSIKAREQRLQSILDNTAEGIITFNTAGKIETWNQSAEALFGWVEEDVVGRSIAHYISPDDIEYREDYIQQFTRLRLRKFIDSEGELTGYHKDGSAFPVSVKIGDMKLNSEVKYTALVADITERKSMMTNLRYLAEHDELTGLYNRSYFHKELERAVNFVKNSTEAIYALLYIDLDNFKYVNDTLGHAAGDKILVDVTRIFQRRVRRSDVLARLGGDEFVLLLSEIEKEDAKIIAEDYRMQMSEYVLHYEGKTIDIGCSIGVALITGRTESVRVVMSQADVACHFAKRAGRNRVHLYSEKDECDVENMSLDMGWSHQIKMAIEKNRFKLAIQPIVKTSNAELECYEVLVRMVAEDNSLIMPSAFIPSAERFGLASNLDKWVIEHSIAYLAEVRKRVPSVKFSINVSAQSLTELSAIELIPSLLDKFNLDPNALIFEVTETTAISNMDQAVRFLRDLNKMGCRTSIDDFGSGMASFAYLRELPVDIVKIDGRFVKNMTNSIVDQSMVKAMNEIAHALGKETVAEFVEDQTHYQLCSAIGIDYVQGYYFDKPKLIEDIFEFLKNPGSADLNEQKQLKVAGGNVIKLSSAK